MEQARRTARLLDRLSAEIASAEAGAPYLLFARLEALRTAVAALPAGQRLVLDRCAGYLRGPVAAVRARAARGELRAAATLRDLRTVVRALACLVEHAREPDLVRRCRVRYAETDAAALTRKCCAAFEEIARARGLRFTVDVPPQLGAELDPDKLEALLSSLLYNAFKHTPQGGRVSCALATAEDDAELVLVVQDSGPSLPPGRAEAIFHRSRYLDRAAPGLLALGLHLGDARDAAALHGGTLDAGDGDGSGVRFELRMPRRAPSAARVAASRERTSDLPERVAEFARAELFAEDALAARADPPDDGRPLVLVALETRSLQRLLVEAFAPEYRVASAFDGSQALAKAERLQPDLILVDRALPGDGKALIHAVRERTALDATAIVLLATRDDPDEELELLEHDVQDVVHKPFLLPELAARVRNLVASKRARDVLRELVDRQEIDLMELADEVAHKQRELQDALRQVETARAAAERANLVKSNFLRVMSHELKTPLTAMQLQLGILARDAESSGDPRLREGYTRIGRAARKLLHLIDTSLEWARVESGRCRPMPERFDLVVAVREVIAELTALAQQKRLEIAIEVGDELDRELVNDRRLFGIVLVNLLSRALQLTPSGKVTLRIDQQGSVRRVAIEDAAPDRYMDRGDPFEPMRASAGSGLGLYVIRDIARAMGAELSFERPDETGHVLTLSIPSLPPGARFESGPPAFSADSTAAH